MRTYSCDIWINDRLTYYINLNIHIFKIWVRYTSFASCSTLSYSFNQKVQWCLRKIGYVQCTAGIWCWIFDGQWMSRIYQYKNWLIHMIWQWRPLTIVFWFNLNLKYQRTMCSFTHFSSPKLKFHTLKRRLKIVEIMMKVIVEKVITTMKS